jgi:hypothetical protein
MFTNNPFSDVKNNIKKQINEHIPLNDKEGEMAMSELNSVIEYANQILQMLKTETQMEAWVQSKITKAKDYLDSVADYLKHTDGALEEKANILSGKRKRLDANNNGKIDSEDFKLLRDKMKKGKNDAKR